MKRIFLLCGLLTAFFLCFAEGVEYKKCVPSEGSTISTFDFILEFDIEKALVTAESAKPGNSFGLGYRGGASYKADLYKGDVESGELLGTTNSVNLTGKSDGFEINGNMVKVSFDSAIPLLPNQTYTVSITNIFYLYPSGSASFVSATKADYSSNPLNLTFKGADLGESKIFVEGSNIEKGSSLEKIENVEFNLSAPFTINSGAEVLIKEGENIIARTSNLKVSPSDGTKLIADFGKDVNLYLGHSYTLILPAESVSLATNSNASNLEFSVEVSGLSKYSIKLVSSNIEDDNGIPTSITFIYDMPDGTILSRQTGTSEAAIGYVLYNNGVVEGRYMGELIENGKGFKWSFSKDNWAPDTEYTFRKEASSIYVCDASGKHLPEYVNEVVEISFTTPSFEAWGYPYMEFKAPVITKTDIEDEADYQEGMKLQKIGTIEFWLKDNWYTLDGQKYNLSLQKDLRLSQDDNINFYEVTPEGDKIILTRRISHRNDLNEACGVGVLNLDTYLYEGKKYKLIIPEGYYTVVPMNNLSDESKANLIRNNEMVLTFEGAAPNKAIFEGSNIPDNSIVPKLYTVNWVFAGPYKLNNENATIKCDRVTVNDFGAIPSSQEMPVNIYTGNNKTYLYVEFMSKISGEPVNVSDKTTYTLTLPKGLLVNTFNDEIVNDEIVLHINGGQEAVPAVDVNLTINDLHSASHKAVKGEKYSFTVAPNDDWKVESVMHGGKVLSAKNGVYTTEPLNEDADIKANLTYAGQLATEITTDVWEITDKNISIYRDNDHIVVDGVTPANAINVYSVSGLLITSIHATDGNDRVNITVPSGQMYIVSVDGVAAKIQM